MSLEVYAEAMEVAARLVKVDGMSIAKACESVKESLGALIPCETLKKHIQSHCKDAPKLAGAHPKMHLEDELELVQNLQLLSTLRIDVNWNVIKNIVN